MDTKTSRRKIFIIVIVTTVIAGVGFFFFGLLLPTAPTADGEPTSFFGRLPIIGGRVGSKVTEAPPATQQPVPGETPGVAEQRRLIQITDEPIIGPAISESGEKIFYYRKRDGHLVSNNFTGGQEETISNLTILNILEVLWSPDRKNAVVTYQDGEIIKRFITEATSTPKVTFLPQESENPAWSPDNNTIFWMTRQEENRTLTSASRNGQNPRGRGFTTPIPDLQPIALTPDIVALIPKTASFYETPLFVLNLKTLAQNTALFTFGLTAINDTDPKSQLVLYNSTNRLGAMQDIHAADLQSGKDTSWPIKTLPEKCVFAKDGTALFCAVPKEIPARGMPEVWYKGQVSFSDAFFRIDLNTSKAEQILSESGYDAVYLATSADKKFLFFTDKKTSFLYSLLLD